MSRPAVLRRRDFLRTLAVSSASLTLAACGSRGNAPGPTPGSGSATVQAPATPKRILILGGTGFIGPKTIDVALARGHSVTIFNRGKREKIQPLAQTNIEHLYGNRDPKLPADEANPAGSPVGLDQLAGKSWDVVIDNSGYVPRHVEASAKLLASNAKHYIFISSISAYAENPVGGDENTKLAELADPTVEKMGDAFENYGGLKVLCERAVTAAFGPNRTTIVRPGYIVGPGDPTDRFTYWPARIAAGGEVLAPGSPDDPLQWIDVRDLAEWLVHLVEASIAGTFNAVGPASPGRWGTVLEACVTAASNQGHGQSVAATNAAKVKLVWVPTAWLDKNGMSGEDAFPIWVPPVDKFVGFHRWKTDRARGAGLTYRTIDDTVEALLEWFPTELERRERVTHELVEAAKAKGEPPPKMADPTALRAGPTREREAELLAAYRKNP
jgi:2'-hydroxyisoflavone reductase